MAEPKYLRTDEAAQYLNVSPRSLEKWRGQRSGPPYVKLGRRLVAYTKDELDRWAERARESVGAA